MPSAPDVLIGSHALGHGFPVSPSTSSRFHTCVRTMIPPFTWNLRYRNYPTSLLTPLGQVILFFHHSCLWLCYIIYEGFANMFVCTQCSSLVAPGVKGVRSLGTSNLELQVVSYQVSVGTRTPVLWKNSAFNQWVISPHSETSFSWWRASALSRRGSPAARVLSSLQLTPEYPAHFDCRWEKHSTTLLTTWTFIKNMWVLTHLRTYKESWH